MRHAHQCTPSHAICTSFIGVKFVAGSCLHTVNRSACGLGGTLSPSCASDERFYMLTLTQKCNLSLSRVGKTEINVGCGCQENKGTQLKILKQSQKWWQTARLQLYDQQLDASLHIADSVVQAGPAAAIC